MTCTCTCPPAIELEHARLTHLGGTWSGCCGNDLHTYGFHLPPCRLSVGDYSLRYGRGPDHSAAAGDFGMDWPGSRKWLARFINELRAGLHPGIVEVIGSLDGKTVNYWARWQGWKTTKYTGQGHDTWTHISWMRTKTSVDQHILDTPTPAPPPTEANVQILVQVPRDPAVWLTDGLTRRWIQDPAERDFYAAAFKTGPVRPITSAQLARIAVEPGTSVPPPTIQL